VLKAKWPGLSHREENVLSLSMAGLGDKEIASSLGVSVYTVRTYWLRIKDKVQKETRAEVIAEVTRRRSRDPALVDSAKRLDTVDTKRSLLEETLGKAPMIVWAFDADGILYYVNENFLTYTGLVPSYTERIVWKGVIREDIWASILVQAVEARQHGEPFELEAPIRRIDGAYRWHLLREIPIIDETGHIVRRVGTATDIDDLHDREQIASQLCFRLKMIADVSRTAISIDDPDANVKYRNPAYLRLTEGSQAHDGWIEDIHPDDRERVRKEWSKHIGTTAPMSSRHRYLHSDGSITTADVRVLELGPRGAMVLACETGVKTEVCGDDQLNTLASNLQEILRMSPIEVC